MSHHAPSVLSLLRGFIWTFKTGDEILLEVVSNHHKLSSGSLLQNKRSHFLKFHLLNKTHSCRYVINNLIINLQNSSGRYSIGNATELREPCRRGMKFKSWAGVECWWEMQSHKATVFTIQDVHHSDRSP